MPSTIGAEFSRHKESGLTLRKTIPEPWTSRAKTARTLNAIAIFVIEPAGSYEPTRSSRRSWWRGSFRLAGLHRARHRPSCLIQIDLVNAAGSAV